MDYEHTHHISTRGAIGCIAILTILGMVLVYLFFEAVRLPPVMGEPYEAPQHIAQQDEP